MKDIVARAWRFEVPGPAVTVFAKILPRRLKEDTKNHEDKVAERVLHVFKGVRPKLTQFARGRFVGTGNMYNYNAYCTICMVLKYAQCTSEELCFLGESLELESRLGKTLNQTKQTGIDSFQCHSSWQKPLY